MLRKTCLSFLERMSSNQGTYSSCSFWETTVTSFSWRICAASALCFAFYVLTRGRLQLFLQLSLLLSDGHEYISYPIPLSFQLLFLFQVTLGILFSSRFPIPSILVGVWVEVSEESKGEESNVQGLWEADKTSHGDISDCLYSRHAPHVSTYDAASTTHTKAWRTNLTFFIIQTKNFGRERWYDAWITHTHTPAEGEVRRQDSESNASVQ